jgi:hypothetical protein
MGDQLVAETATYISRNRHRGRIYKALSGIRMRDPANRRFQNYVSDRTANGIGRNYLRINK